MVYKPISDYEAIENMVSAALVGKDGSVDWCCLPRFDSPSIFAAILDDDKDGTFSIKPEVYSESSQSYLIDTNVFYGTKLKVDYTTAPRAVYSHPQIAAVGLREGEVRKNHEIMAGKTNYFDVAKGEAMMEKESYAKAIVEKGTDKILGFHIIGPYAPELIQEVVNAMSSGGYIEEIDQGIYIHPARSELIPTTLNNLQ